MGNTHFTVEKTIHEFSGRMLVFFFFTYSMFYRVLPKMWV